MKSSNANALLESIGTSTAQGESRSETISESRGETRSRGVMEGTSCSVSDGTEEVEVTITSTSGFEDAEAFPFRSRKSANAFARQIMTATLKAYDRRDGDAD